MKGSPPLEAHHAVTAQGPLDELLVDLLLGPGGLLVTPSPDVEAFDSRAYQRQQARRHEFVVEDDVRFPQALGRAHGQQPRIAGASAHQAYETGFEYRPGSDSRGSLRMQGVEDLRAPLVEHVSSDSLSRLADRGRRSLDLAFRADDPRAVQTAHQAPQARTASG